MTITIKPRPESGPRSGQQRTWMTTMKKEIFLRNDKAREIVQFIPQGETVILIGMFLTLTGCFAQTSRSTRTVLTVAAGRRVYKQLLRSGYRPW